MPPDAHRGRLAALLLSVPALAAANPSDPTVIHGAADFESIGDVLEVRSDPGTIIDWGGFSIGADELARFLQQSADSAVLNRVVGDESSEILGTLASNGRVFLINPNGVVFGDGAVVDTAGFVASTLEMTDADFLAGDLRLAGDGGRVVNAGMLTTKGGNVFFVAPEIENSGIVHAEDGSLTLAAGREVRIASLDEPGVEVLVQAPENAVLNLGDLIAERGAVRALAGTIEHSGAIEASSVAVDEDGAIVLRAQDDVTLAAGSRLDASGADGGDVDVRSEGGDVVAQGAIDASGEDGTGGRVRLLGDRVALAGEAAIDATGTSGGGEVLVGGNARGEGPEPNAARTYVGPDVGLDASATASGDGGRLIVYSEDETRVYGMLLARGGTEGGNGGFIETSGGAIQVTTTPDAGAADGAPGEWLIDPDVLVVSGNAQTDITTATPTGETVFTGGEGAVDSQIGDEVLEAVIAGGTSLTLDTGQSGQDIIIDAPLDFEANVDGLSVTFQANEGITVDQPIVNSGTSPLDYTFRFDQSGFGAGNLVVNADIVTGPAGGGTILFDALEGGDAFLTGPITLDGALVSQSAITTNVSDPSGLVRVTGQTTLEDVLVDGGDLRLDFVDPEITNDIQSLRLLSGSFGGAGAASVEFLFDWFGGELAGTGELVTGPSAIVQLDFAGPDDDLGGDTPLEITDYSLGLDSAASWTDGDITMSGDAALRVLDGGAGSLDATFAEATAIRHGGGDPLLDIETATTANISNGGAPLTVEVRTNNAGDWDVNSSLSLLGGGVQSGTFTLAAGTTLEIADTLGSGHQFTAASTVDGDAFQDGRLLVSPGGTHVFDGGTLDVGTIDVLGGALQLDGDYSTNAVTLVDGTLGGTGDLFTTSLDWEPSGTLTGTGTTTVGGDGGGIRMLDSGIATDPGTRTLAGNRVLVNDALLDWTEGDLFMDGNAVLVSDAFTGFFYTGDGDAGIRVAGGTPQVFLEVGSDLVVNSPGSFTIEARMSNAADVSVDDGLLALNGGGLQDAAFEIADGATLRFGGGEHVLFDTGRDETLDTGLFAIGELGTGIAEITAGRVLLGVDPFFGAQELPMDNLRLAGGVLGAAPSAEGSMPADAVVRERLEWLGGDLGDGTTEGTLTLERDASGTIGGTAARSIGDGYTLLNRGTLTWTGGDISLGTGAVLRTAADPLAEVPEPIPAAFTIDLASPGAIEGAGNFAIGEFSSLTDRSTATATIGALADLSGTVTAAGADLHFTRGNTYAGDFVVDGGLLRFSDVDGTGNTLEGSLTGSGTVAFSGAGTTTVASGTTYDTGATLIDTGTVAFETAESSTTNLTLTDGTLAGAGTLLVTGTSTWNGTGEMIGSGTTRLGEMAQLTIEGAGTRRLGEQRTLSNAASIVWTGGDLALDGDAALVSSGEFLIDNAGAVAMTTTGGAPLFSSSGALAKTGAGTADIGVSTALQGTGTVDGGVLALTAPTTQGAAFTIADPGVLRVAADTTLGETGSLTGSGTLELTAGTLELTGTNEISLGTLAVSGGTLDGGDDGLTVDALSIGGGTVDLDALALAAQGTATVDGGSLETATLSLASDSTTTLAAPVTVSGDATADGRLTLEGTTLTVGELLLGGTLAGNGTVAGPVTNTGLVSAGASPGAITIEGDFVQTADGRILIEVAGTTSTAGSDFDLVEVTGAATLGGTLEFAALGTYDPTLGDVLVPITWGSVTGDFAEVIQPTSFVVYDPIVGTTGLETTLVELNGNTLGGASQADVVAAEQGTTVEEIEASQEVVELDTERRRTQEECEDAQAPEQGGDDGRQGVACRSI